MASLSPLILIVEDEAPQAEMLIYNLEKEGYDTEWLNEGGQAEEIAEEKMPDLIILDWMVPNVSGVEICGRLRANPQTKEIPIIMLTARGEESDKLYGFDKGADDYVVKPYLPSELIARIKAILRRSGNAHVQNTLETGQLQLNLDTHRVTADGQNVHLGPKEFKILTALMEKPGRVLSRERLLDLVWGRDVYVENRTVDVHIRRLRKAISDAAGIDPIRTVRGSGYAINELS